MDSIVDAARQRDEYERRIRADERRAIWRALLRDRTLFPAEREPLVRILKRRDARAKKEAGR